MCPTRWVQRHDAIMVMLQLFNPVIESLNAVSLWDERETASSANILLNAVEQAEFVIALLS